MVLLIVDLANGYLDGGEGLI
ncbi:protein of unknown function [Magnetospirillum gryphiswaldense MSR-1 v2]|uniref:Uncharacterized protein n=1 Tax=Magnetospirillum gryphiswaldense (strain DSM 6361 / JCM 21280 / NBRC 15271 / MSR-1) TaxID=431944 RepID=V6F835_MAGGM|nr:protein of unknown function [Magnetospirillum gryphiswaldense MSR-1 v2]